MRMFIKSQLSSFLATVVDFSITYVFTELFNSWYLLSGILGTICGGVFNFLFNRHFVFSSFNEKALHQAAKYIIVWLGYLGLSTLMLFFLTDFFKINYLISKITTAVLLGFTYNFLLQKHFVFSAK